MSSMRSANGPGEAGKENPSASQSLGKSGNDASSEASFSSTSSNSNADASTDADGGAGEFGVTVGPGTLDAGPCKMSREFGMTVTLGPGTLDVGPLKMSGELGGTLDAEPGREKGEGSFVAS